MRLCRLLLVQCDVVGGPRNIRIILIVGPVMRFLYMFATIWWQMQKWAPQQSPLWCGSIGKSCKNACMHPFPLKTYLLCGNMFADPCSFFTDPDLDPTFLFSRIRNSFFSFKRITLINITFSFFILFTFTLHSRTLYSFSSDCFLLKSLYIDYFS